MSRATTLDRRAKQTTTEEWIIYPTGAGAFACGSPDGRELQNTQELEVYLAGRWIAGVVEHRPHVASRFITLDDHSACGLCAGMKVRLAPDHSSLASYRKV